MQPTVKWPDITITTGSSVSINPKTRLQQHDRPQSLPAHTARTMQSRFAPTCGYSSIYTKTRISTSAHHHLWLALHAHNYAARYTTDQTTDKIMSWTGERKHRTGVVVQGHRWLADFIFRPADHSARRGHWCFIHVLINFRRLLESPSSS